LLAPGDKRRQVGSGLVYTRREEVIREEIIREEIIRRDYKRRDYKKTL